MLIAVAGADLGMLARDIGLGARNTTAVDALASARSITVFLLPVAVVAAVRLTARTAHEEWRRGTHSPARLVYLGSTAALLVVLAVEPVTGFVAYIGAQAAEYFLVVRWRMSRAAERAAVGDRVGALARSIGSSGSIVLYGAGSS